MESLGETFASVPDPRAGNARHDLAEILVIAFAATLCGAETCCDMALFGRAKEPLLREFLALPHGIPSHDTFSRVFRFLDPAAFEMAFRHFTAAFAERLSGRTGLAGTVVAIDGKSLAGACEAGARATPLHLVTAWAADQRLVLAQRRAPGRSEVTAALEVVGMLDLLGATVTADALHGTRRMAAAIRARGGDYALVVKGNRGPLHRAMRDLLQGAEPAARTSETAHGRREERAAVVRPVPPDWQRFGFEGLAAVARIDSVRHTGAKARARPDTSPSRARCRQRKPCASCGLTGPSRTASTGSSTSSWTRTAPAAARTTPPKTSPSCDVSPSTSCAPTPTSLPCAARSKRPDGTINTSSTSSPKCDSPPFGRGAGVRARPHRRRRGGAIRAGSAPAVDPSPGRSARLDLSLSGEVGPTPARRPAC